MAYGDCVYDRPPMKTALFLILAVSVLALNVHAAQKPSMSQADFEDAIVTVYERNGNFFSKENILSSVRFIQGLTVKSPFLVQSTELANTVFPNGDYLVMTLKTIPPMTTSQYTYIWNVKVQLIISLETKNENLKQKVSLELKDLKPEDMKSSANDLSAVIDLGTFKDKPIIDNTLNLVNSIYTDIIKSQVH